MFNFKFYTPTKVVFGKDTELKVAELINELGVTATDEDLVLMAHKCAVGVGGSMGSAKCLDEAAMLEIFRNAM